MYANTLKLIALFVIFLLYNILLEPRFENENEISTSYLN